ncbi:MAG: hypothetical protein RMK91_07580 [Pseudanabaenaceae cyanobacterium SKYGB_i_bin29]|nr:hypothetical protein [Pseudanabaenaceae cyanobacterium SKYG29]MDW8421713.1 hypothetical protein [Pseudanabaenaceae cyanobacterium SKYGB_i_bin29]
MRQIYLSLLISLGLHGLILLFVPSPLPWRKNSSDLEIVSLTPLIELTEDSPSLPESDISLIPPIQSPLSVPPLDFSSKIPPPPADLPSDLSFEKIPEPPRPKFNPSPPTALPPPPSSPPAQLDIPLPSIPPAAAEVTAPKPLPTIALDPGAYTQEFANIYGELVSKCGVDNVVRLTIPAPDEVVSQVSETIASDVPWLPPVYVPTDILGGLEIVIPVTLVVEGDGSISRRRFISSNLAIIDGIILQTIDGYEGKFPPAPGKCRLVTTRYKFSGN